MSIILASGELETIFVDGVEGPGPLTLTARCNFCGYETSCSWAQEDRERALENDEGAREGRRTAWEMMEHMLVSHPEKLSAREHL